MAAHTKFYIKYDAAPEFRSEVANEIQSAGWIISTASSAGRTRIRVALEGKDEWELAHMYHELRYALESWGLGNLYMPERPTIKRGAAI